MYIYYTSVTIIRGERLDDVGSEKANWDNTLPVKDSHTILIYPLGVYDYPRRRFSTISTSS
jgi:hypothetical protein